MAPRINASGRLADASLPIELLLDDDYQACRTRAEQLDTINRERQAIERRIAQEAEERAMRSLMTSQVLCYMVQIGIQV